MVMVLLQGHHGRKSEERVSAKKILTHLSCSGSWVLHRVYRHQQVPRIQVPLTIVTTRVTSPSWSAQGSHSFSTESFVPKTPQYWESWDNWSPVQHSQAVLLWPPVTDPLQTETLTCSVSQCPASSATLGPDTQTGTSRPRGRSSTPPTAAPFPAARRSGPPGP